MIGDFNIKVENHTQDNKKTISKGGSHVKRTIDKCKEKWKRGQGEEKSIIVQVTISQE